MVRNRFARGLVFVALVVSTCGFGAFLDGPDAADAADPETTELENLKPWKPKPKTAWGRVEAAIRPDGTVPKKVALQAFALTVGKLPGVQKPAGKTGDVHEGTTALRWLAPYLPELTPKQRTAVAAALEPVDAEGRPASKWPAPLPSGGPGRSRPVAKAPAPKLGCYGDPVVECDAPGADKYRPVLDAERAALESHLGPLGMPVYLVFAKPFGENYASTTATNDDCTLSASSCTIRLHPAGVALGSGQMPSVLAHELVHCFQHRFLPVDVASAGRAAWIIEGFPEWAANQLHPGGSQDTTNAWTNYLNHPRRSLFQRVYDGVGFFAHVQFSGGDPWSTYRNALQPDDNAAQFDAVVASSRSRFEAIWGSTHARDNARGSAWDMSLPAIPDSKPDTTKASVTNTTAASMSATPVSNRLWKVGLKADVISVSVVGQQLGRVSWDGGPDTPVSVLDGATFCARSGGCRCPGDDGPDLDPAPGQSALVAVTGTAQGTVVKFTGSKLKVKCKEPPPTAVVDRCLVGKWRNDPFTVPGPVGYSPSGGDGAVVTIQSNGDVTWDFSAMEPMVSRDEQIDVTTALSTSGSATGHVTAQNGTWDIIDVDKSMLQGRMTDTLLRADRPIAGGPGLFVMIGDGTYTCGPGTIEFSSIDPVENQPVPITLKKV